MGRGREGEKRGRKQEEKEKRRGNIGNRGCLEKERGDGRRYGEEIQEGEVGKRGEWREKREVGRGMKSIDRKKGMSNRETRGIE